MKITWLRQLFLFIFGTCVARQQLVFPRRFCRNLLLCPFQQLTIIHVSDKVQDSGTMDNTDGRGKKQAKSERVIFQGGALLPLAFHSMCMVRHEHRYLKPWVIQCFINGDPFSRIQHQHAAH